MDNTAFQEANLRLIKEVRKRPTLYDKSLLSYTRKSAQNQAWNEIARILGWEASSCKERWRNLRCVYIRHVRKMNKGNKMRPYYLMNALRFIRPFLNIKRDTNLPMDQEDNNEELDNEENKGNAVEDTANDEDYKNGIDGDNCGNYKKEETIVPKILKVSSLVQHNLSRSATPNEIHAFETACMPSPGTHIKLEDGMQSPDLNMSGSTSQNNDSIELQCTQKNTKTSMVQVEISDVTPPHLELQDDARKMFLLSILPDVYEMNDAQMRTFKRGVLNLIGSIFDNSIQS